MKNEKLEEKLKESKLGGGQNRIDATIERSIFNFFCKEDLRF